MPKPDLETAYNLKTPDNARRLYAGLTDSLTALDLSKQPIYGRGATGRLKDDTGKIVVFRKR